MTSNLKVEGGGTSTVVKSSWLSALLIGASVIGVAIIFGQSIQSFIRVRYQEHTITVRGSATKRIHSDLVTWTARVHARADTLPAAYAELQKGTPRVRAFLMEKGIPEDEISVGAISSEELYARNEKGYTIREKIIGYDIFQNVGVTSSNIKLVTKVAQEITELIQEGVDVRSNRPDYLYTGLGALKVQLIAEATRDARDRAKQVAQNAGATVGRLTSASVGVIQVNAANESDVSWEGVSDRSSIDKDAMVVVRTTFVLE